MQKVSFALIAIFLMAAVPFMGAVQGVDADASHPVPQDADFSKDLGSFSFSTDSPAYVMDFYEMSQTDDSDNMFAFIAEAIYYGDNRGDFTIVSSYSPGWITVTHPVINSMRSYLTITPGGACDDTFWFKIFSANSTFVLYLHVTVTDSGSVVPDPDQGQNSFTLRFDVHGGSAVSSMYRTSSDSQVSFDISNVLSEKEGYTFKGWAVDEEGESLLSGTVTVRINDDSDHALKIIHAVWEEKSGGIVIPTLFDGLIELFTNPVFLLIFIAGVLGLAYFIRGRQRCRFL